MGRKFAKDNYQNKSAYARLTIARTLLFVKYPFWGHLAMSITFVEDPTGYVRTMATDARNIYYAVPFVERYSTPHELMFVIAHELWHILSAHVGKARRGDRDRRLWNRAGDFYINAELIAMGCGIPPKGFPLCYNPDFAGLTTEQIYDKLVEEQESLMESFDDHMDVEPSLADPNDTKIADQWRMNVIRADSARRMAEQAGMGSGNEMPANLRRMIADMHAPKKDWRRVLRRFTQMSFHRGYSYLRPNKSAFQSGIIIPGFRKKVEEFDLAIAIDTSMSIGLETLTKALSEVYAIIKQLPKFRIAIWTFDSDVYENSYKIITSRDGKGFSSMEPFLKSVDGGGGTLFESNWTFMRERRIRPKAFIMITDGLPNDTWGEATYCPTLFVIINERNIRAPFGQTVAYE